MTGRPTANVVIPSADRLFVVSYGGSYEFSRDRIASGWLKASLRSLDEPASRPFDPVPSFSNRQPLPSGQVVQPDGVLGPSATFFHAGETLWLVVGGCS